MFNPKNFFALLAPMYYVTKIIGLAPFCINTKGYKISKINLLFSIILMFFINIYISTSISAQIDIKLGFITKVTAILDTYLSQAGLCCGILFGCIFVKEILNSINDINKFDLHMLSIFHTNLKKEYRKSSICIVLGLIVTSTYVLLSFSVTIIVTKDYLTVEFIQEFLAYVFPALINTFVDFQFCTIILCLKQRLKWLNNIVLDVSTKLEKNLQECDDIFFVTTKGMAVRPTTHIVAAGIIQDEATNIFKKVRTKHYDLCSISKRINRAYSVQILLIVVQSFITIIAGLLYTGQHIFISAHISVEYLLYASLQLNSAIMQVVILVIVCSSTSAEAHKMGILIHSAISLKLENKCKTDLQSEITSFSLQLLHHNIEFTACRIFVINESLLFSIVGAITTYMVIVIQFELVDTTRK